MPDCSRRSDVTDSYFEVYRFRAEERWVLASCKNGSIVAIHGSRLASYPDKLHDIVRNWQPGKYTKSFLCHLVELVHTTLKTLEWYTNGKAKYIGGVDVSMADAEDMKGQADKAVLDRVAAAKKFDFHRYFRRLATNQ